jgi:hypothetical protein
MNGTILFSNSDEKNVARHKSRTTSRVSRKLLRKLPIPEFLTLLLFAFYFNTYIFCT